MNTNNHPKARVLAYYLPQFHPIPENDEWWGKGFTEWTNVGKAKPLFPGHYQPRVPADLGYYDLRVPETREAQAQMAREYGIEGFVYWHYWFGNGKRLLERPFNEVLASGKPDFPFALAWANETWTGFSHGVRDNKMLLIEQKYPGKQDYVNHFYEVLPAFKDKRYIKCDGKPIFVIYRPEQIPDVRNFIELWQSMAIENGLRGIYFIAHRVGGSGDKASTLKYLTEKLDEGFCAINNVFVWGNGLVKRYDMSLRGINKWMKNRIMHKLLNKWPEIIPYNSKSMSSELDYRDGVIPTVIPNWDHSPRTGSKGYIVDGSTPVLFEDAVRIAVNAVADKNYDKRIIMIKSWNEWAEGNYMEPDLKWGRGYLEALSRAISQE